MSPATVSQAAVSQAGVRSFSSLLPDVSTLHVVSKLRDQNGRTAAEDLAQIRAEARDQGYLEGLRAGEIEGLRQGIEQGRALGMQRLDAEFRPKREQAFAELTSDLSNLIERVNAQIPKWFEDAEFVMTERALEIVRRLLSAELALTQHHALEIVKEALSEVNHARRVRVRLNPFDSVVIAQHRDELMSAAEQVQDLVLVDDPNIDGGCVVESDGGTVDARLSLRLAMVEEDLAS